MATKKSDDKIAPEGGEAGAEPSSHDTCGQFPADEVAATHGGEDPGEPK